MFDEDVTFFIYLGWMSLGWSLVLAGILLVLRFLRSWLLTAFIRHHQFHENMCDSASVASNDYVSAMISRNHRPQFCRISYTVPNLDSPPPYEDVINEVQDACSDSMSIPNMESPPLYNELYPCNE